MSILKKILLAISALLTILGIVLTIISFPQNPYGPLMIASTGFLAICILIK